jgi:hypothetical protein
LIAVIIFDGVKIMKRPIFKYSQLWSWLRDGQLRGRSSSPGRVKNFHFSKSSRPALGPTQPPIQWVPEDLSPGVKGPGCEADNSPATSAEVKKMWIYTSTFPYAFNVRHRPSYAFKTTNKFEDICILGYNVV